ncbi:oocyte zinc finger protein XlCOF6 isoform X1 [Hydra vulgaris]|uniref:oocyte zinc finger protein XlCOF6 isoform X1 n=1 Tax=Hydra vulgaris TaxID=6087 RepID=UPI001F5E5503|nr:oocyte zinc finger protein XlCOF6 isoform X1 [Hydra vulgaris]
MEINSNKNSVLNEVVGQNNAQENVLKKSYQLRSKEYPKRGKETNHKKIPENVKSTNTKEAKIKIRDKTKNCKEVVHANDKDKEEEHLSEFENHVEKTLILTPPEGMEIKKSLIPNAGLGVFATQKFDVDIIFGPYQGIKVPLDVPKDDIDTSYMWRVMKDGVDVYYIDGKDERYANWMRYINCSRYEAEQNLEAFHCQGEIYYRIYKQVEKGKEFLVWYGDEYAKDLGIEGSYPCRKCSECFTSEEFLKSHIKRCKTRGRNNIIQALSMVHPNEFTVDLTSCSNVNGNNTSVGFENYSECNENLMFTPKTSLTDQLQTESNNKTLKCSYCEFECFMVSELTKHIGIHLVNNLNKCPFCDYKCMRPYIMEKHMQVHCYKKTFKCTFCLYKSTTMERLERHLRVHLNCREAGQLQTQNCEKPFKCKYCNFESAYEMDLKRHSRYHYLVKLLKCTYCDYICKAANNFRLHMRTHTGEKPFKCSYCEYKCAQKSNLTVHLRIHSNEKPFKCTYCNYECKQKFNLTLHTRTHTKVKPYKCPYCDYKCSSKLAITTHKRKHTLEKPFHCTICDYKCSIKGYLKIHERTHANDKPFKCTVCNYSSNVKSNLKKHSKLHMQ